MQLEGAQLFRTRGAGRATAEKTGELLDGADILTLRIGGEIVRTVMSSIMRARKRLIGLGFDGVMLI